MDENGSFYKRLRYGVAWPASKTWFTRYVGLLQRRLGIAYTTTSSPGRFSLALEVGREKDIFVWTGKNDSKIRFVWRRVIFLKKWVHVDLWMGHAFRRTLTPNTSPENPPLTLPREWYHPGVASRNPLTSAFLGIELSCLRDVYVSTLKGIYSLKRIKWNVLTVKMVSLRKTRSCHWNVQNVAQRFACHPLQCLKTTTNRPLTSVSKEF